VHVLVVEVELAEGEPAELGLAEAAEQAEMWALQDGEDSV